MMTIRKNNEETKEYLDSLPRIYVIVKGLNWDIIDFPCESIDRDGIEFIPMVWNYNDHNGETDRFELVPLEDASMNGCAIFTWTINHDLADTIKLLLQRI